MLVKARATTCAHVLRARYCAVLVVRSCRRTPKHMLEYIFKRLVDFKKFDQGGGDEEDVPGGNNNDEEALAKIGNSVGVSAGAGRNGAGAGVGAGAGAGTGGAM